MFAEGKIIQKAPRSERGTERRNLLETEKTFFPILQLAAQNEREATIMPTIRKDINRVILILMVFKLPDC